MDPVGNQCRILIIDDEPSIGRMVSYVLADLGCELLIANDAETGLKIVEDSLPQLVICDVRLPGMDGVEFTMTIKAEHPGLPVLLMSAYGEPGQHFADGFITKPFDNDQLLMTARRLLAVYQGRRAVRYGGTWPLDDVNLGKPGSSLSE